MEQNPLATVLDVLVVHQGRAHQWDQNGPHRVTLRIFLEIISDKLYKYLICVLIVVSANERCTKNERYAVGCSHPANIISGWLGNANSVAGQFTASGKCTPHCKCKKNCEAHSKYCLCCSQLLPCVSHLLYIFVPRLLLKLEISLQLPDQGVRRLQTRRQLLGRFFAFIRSCVQVVASCRGSRKRRRCPQGKTQGSGWQRVLTSRPISKFADGRP